MNPQDIDRHLANDAAISPSPRFVDTVMREVRRTAASPPPLAFPWKVALPGLVLCVAGIIALALMPRGSGLDSTPVLESLTTSLVRIADSPTISWSAAILFGTGIAARWVFLSVTSRV